MVKGPQSAKTLPLALDSSRATKNQYRVVGVRQNGATVPLWRGSNADTAERILRLVSVGGGYQSVRIEVLSDQPDEPQLTGQGVEHQLLEFRWRQPPPKG